MPVQPLEIYQVDYPFRNSADPRPAVILEPELNGRVAIALISGQIDLFNPMLHFHIPKDDPDFHATGLTKPSYVAGDEIFEISTTKLLFKRGVFTGDLAVRFKRWI